MPSAKQLAKFLHDSLSPEDFAALTRGVDAIVRSIQEIEATHVPAAPFRKEAIASGE